MLSLIARAWEALTRRIDRMLFGCALAIVGVGIVTLFSAADQSVARGDEPDRELRFRDCADVADSPTFRRRRSRVPRCRCTSSRC